MQPASDCLPEDSALSISSIERAIRDFLVGETDGADLFHALYDHVLDEAVPSRLLAVLRT